MNSNNLDEALLSAADEGDTEEVARLLEAGADVHARNGIQQTPLLCAASEGHAETVQLLLAHGAEIEARDKYGDTALLSAALSFHVSALRVLLDWRANPNVWNQSGFNPLHFCFLYIGDKVQAQLALLLERGADPNGEDRVGDSPLMNATNEPEFVRLLIQHGAKVNARNRAGKTALQVAYDECDYEAAELLEQAGATL